LEKFKRLLFESRRGISDWRIKISVTAHSLWIWIQWSSQATFNVVSSL